MPIKPGVSNHSSKSALQSIDRRSDLTFDEFADQYARPGKPVIITDATAGWEALNWTPESLAALAPEAVMKTIPTGTVDLGDCFEMTLKEYLEYFQAPDERQLYMISWAFQRDYPELMRDFEVPIYFRDDWLLELEDPLEMLWIFLGPAHSGLLMHQDIARTPAWNVQLTGQKCWKMWPPEQEKLLYKGEVNAFEPDLKRFPRFAQAQAVEGVVGPGECIFVPPCWWHQTQNIEAGLAMTANYVDQFSYRGVLESLRSMPELAKVHQGLQTIANRKLTEH